jgi:glycosyltransferase involved in cell wall biosynthesis
MKILFTTSNDGVPWGGSEELWYKAALYSAAQGHEVKVCVKWNPLPTKLQNIQNIPNLTFIEKKIKYNQFNKYLPSRFRSLEEIYKKKIATWQPDVAIISQGNNADGLDLIEFFNDNKIPYLTISQAVYEGIWPDSQKAERMALAYKNAKYNFFVSKANKNMTELMIGEPIENGRVIQNPFNVPYNAQIPFPDINNGFNLACVARYEFYAKGQDVLLEVLNEKKWRERDLFLNFYGNGFNESGIKKLITYFKIQKAKVNVFTPTEDIWKANHALVLPSRFEGLPLALVEAMLCARFGIVSNVSGNSEAFTDNETGFLAEAPKPEYLDKAMERAWILRNEWEIIGKKAQSHIKSITPERPEKELYNYITL